MEINSVPIINLDPCAICINIEGTMVNIADKENLTNEYLLKHLRSYGGRNILAENMLGFLLGRGKLTEEIQEEKLEGGLDNKPNHPNDKLTSFVNKRNIATGFIFNLMPTVSKENGEQTLEEYIEKLKEKITLAETRIAEGDAEGTQKVIGEIGAMAVIFLMESISEA